MAISTTLRLDDKYTRQSGRVFITGIQALVRLPITQRQRDLAVGHDTAGFISGYRGSPLGGYDQQLQRAGRLLGEHHVQFKPGVNEDLAATAAWGTQQAGLNGEGRYEGVFAIWYGKGPGVDRSGDALRHGNLAGTDPLGGVLALLGDDHTCESSTTAHQSELAMVDAMIPILNPSGVQDILDFGLYGWAMSRYSGCWVALKCVHDTVESTASVEVGPDRVHIAEPTDYQRPSGGLNIRWPDTPQQQEERLHNDKLEAAKAFCRANGLDRVVAGGAKARIGVATTGKSYRDVWQALDELGVDEAGVEHFGMRLYKVAMTWPLEPSAATRFAEGLDLVIVVEEKRALIEPQLKELLYGHRSPPRIIGKRDEDGLPLFPSSGRLDTNRIGYEIGRRVLRFQHDALIAERVAEKARVLAAPLPRPLTVVRSPYFCAGCPHNSSTRVPEGSRALAGIGCHYMVQWMDRDTARFTQMGAEGASWIGEAPFSTRRHMFQNIGDGTYFHSGLLAIRAAVAARANITFKILYNDAVAMTGGQSVDGPLSVPQITRQVDAEGAHRVAVVTDEPKKYGSDPGFAPGVSVHHRDELDAVQRRLRDIEGTTVLVYDQICAAEKRRRRKRGRYPDPPRRVFINEDVCEGCGDCGEKSNCVAVLPLETELGRKRKIDQYSCNKDFSCLDGFCPSFVTIKGGRLRAGTTTAGAGVDSDSFAPLSEPDLDALDEPCGVVVTGVGGTGVITVGALLGMAAHLEGKGCEVIDMTGLAQKGGAVTTHLRIGRSPQAVRTPRIAPGGARVLLGCDMLVAGSAGALATMRRGVTKAVINTHEVMTGEFTRNGDMRLPASELRARIEECAGLGNANFVDATTLATRLLGDPVATNLFLVGYAYQAGLLPISSEAIDRAIELNGVAVELNRNAFLWGRRAADQPRLVDAIAGIHRAVSIGPRSEVPLEVLLKRCTASLTAYKSRRYAARYRALVERVCKVEGDKTPGHTGLAEAVARSYHKLLAYKDEYEVARLFTDGRFAQRLNEEFDGDYTIELHLAPPFLARRKRDNGEPRKIVVGSWGLQVFRLLAALRWLRGTVFDPFGYTAERKLERRLVSDYEAVVEELLENLSTEKHRLAVEIAELPELIRGFGHVKARNATLAKKRQQELMRGLCATEERPVVA